MTHESSRAARFNGEKVLQILSAVIIPLVIALATICITIQQNALNKANRENDIYLAQKQREQDLFLANQTREQDRELNNRQRIQEQTLADHQRQDQLLDSYIRELSQLLLSSDFNLTRRMRESIVRPQTMAVLRQLSARRKTEVILFLFESGLLIRGNDPINLIGANLDGINFDVEENSVSHAYLFHLALSGTSLVNASFRNRQLGFADFRHTQMRGVSFEGASLFSAEFFLANLQDAKFGGANLRLTDLSFINLSGSDLSEKQLQKEILTLANATLPDGHTHARAPNLLINGDAEQGSSFGWQLGNRTQIMARQYTNDINGPHGKWYFDSTSNGTHVYMFQRVDLFKYKNMIEHGGVHIVLSIQAMPATAKLMMHVKTFDSLDHELQNELHVLTSFEFDHDYVYASGFVPCKRNMNSMEVAVKVLGAKRIDNIRASIEHVGHSVE